MTQETKPEAAQTTAKPKAAETRFVGVARDPEALDQVVGVTPLRGWLALGTLAVVLLAALVWSLTARIPQQFSVPAVIVDPGAGEVAAGTTGTIDDISVEPGQHVDTGEEIATIRTVDGKSVSVAARAPGLVRDVLVVPGQGVDPLDALITTASVTSQTDAVHVVTFVSAQRADEYFFDGGTILLDVPNITTGLSQTLRAEITSVAEVPSSLEGVSAEIGDAGLAQQLTAAADGSPYRIEATIDPQARGARTAQLTSGQVADATVVYANPHPMGLLFGGRD